MFKIGEFSQFSRVSVKMLRHYDHLGLLQPAHVDPFSNYRYYTADQLPRLQRLLALKDLGFSLEQIKVLLDDDLSTEQLRGMLKLRRTEIQARLQEEQERLARVEMRLDEIERAASVPPYDVVVRSVADERIASIRQKVDSGTTTVTRLFEELEAYVAHHEARAPRPPLLLYHDSAYPDEVQDVEVAIPVQGTLPADERVQVRVLAGHDTIACVVHTGSYDTLSHALATLLGWTEQSGYAIAGGLREAYLRFGADEDGYTLPDVYLATRDDEFVTELQLPITKRVTFKGN